MRSVLVLLLLLPLVLGAPVLAGGGDDPGDAKTLRDLHEKLGKSIRWLSQLREWQLAAGRTEQAADTAITIAKLVAEQTEIGRRLAGGAVAAPAAPAAPAPKVEAPGPAPVPTGRAGLRNLRKAGGSARTQDAVELALEWLANHQDPDGFWDCDGFMEQCRLNQCDGAGYALYDPGVSGLALLAFLGTGQTHKSGKHRDAVAKGLEYLRSIQDADGCFGPKTTNHFTYNHAICALAMAEGFGQTASPLLRRSAQLGADFVHAAQNPYLAWRYGVQPGDNDTSVTGWMVQALYAAKRAGLRVDDIGFDGAKAWIDKVTEPEYGRVGYTARGTGPARPQDLMDKFPADKSESLTGVGIFVRILAGEAPKRSEMIQKGTDLCLKNLPRWDEAGGSIDLYYWFYGTNALFQVGGDAWKNWNGALKVALLDHQRREGDEKGSWDPAGPWGREGGRVMSTALAALTLEVYYRIPRIFD